ncbi:tetratricopeptide repeat protein [Alcanivorax sp. IO_7]|nr:tetratricopeptide repeat protein [Alcanivorax sp. IO_7]
MLAPMAARYPKVPAAVINHGEILRRLGRFDEAAAVLENAVARLPDLPVARFNLALALRGAGRRRTPWPSIVRRCAASRTMATAGITRATPCSTPAGRKRRWPATGAPSSICRRRANRAPSTTWPAP